MHPGEFRENIVKAAQEVERGTSFRARALSTASRHRPDEALLHQHSSGGGSGAEGEEEEGHDHAEEMPLAHGKDGAMNMHGVWLHVLGDAVSGFF